MLTISLNLWISVIVPSLVQRVIYVPYAELTITVQNPDVRVPDEHPNGQVELPEARASEEYPGRGSETRAKREQWIFVRFHTSTRKDTILLCEEFPRVPDSVT